jgi:hypothetical protein
MNFDQPQPTNETEKENLNIETLEQLKSELEKLYEDNLLIAHQTWNHSAQKIQTDEYFSHDGLEGTALALTVEDIMQVAPELDKPVSERTILTHKGADSLVIMTFPRQLLDGLKKRLKSVDEYLIDLVADGKIKQYGLPTSNVLGYYCEGKFHKNPNYDKDALSSL